MVKIRSNFFPFNKNLVVAAARFVVFTVYIVLMTKAQQDVSLLEIERYTLANNYVPYFAEIFICEMKFKLNT